MSRLRFTPLLVLLCLLLSGAPVALAQSSFALPQLMELLAARKESRASFVERKHIALLDAPVESSGSLYFRAPDLMEKRIDKPRPELMRLDGETLSLTRDGQTRQLRLSDYREVAVLVNSLRSTLAGNRRALEDNFALHLAGNREAWTLSLLPKDGNIANLAQRITLEGRGDVLHRVEILQGDGDRSEMLITENRR